MNGYIYKYQFQFDKANHQAFFTTNCTLNSVAVASSSAVKDTTMTTLLLLKSLTREPLRRPRTN